jgi:hypothetical protein
MAERYEVDAYSSKGYSDESINVGSVCSWSICDVEQHRPVVNVSIGGTIFNSDSQEISDERLYRLADCLQQTETGDRVAHIARGTRTVRASLRDYEEEGRWASMTLRPPRRVGERIELESVPHEKYFQVFKRVVAA